MVCNICNSKQIKSIGEINDFEYDLSTKAYYNFCEKCNTVFNADPLEFLDKKMYPKQYIPTGNNFVFNSLKNLYSSYEYRKIEKVVDFKISKKILELGCGNGFLLKKIAKKNKNVLCLGIDFGIKDFKSYNLSLVNDRIENLEKLKKFEADIVILNNVIEHLKSFEFIKNFFSILNAKTKVIILTPDLNSHARKSFSILWSGYHSPRHNFVFSINSFNEICKICNLKIDKNSKLLDPFSNLISIKNAIKAKFLLKNTNIKVNLFSLLFKIFDDFLFKNRIFLVLEKI